MNRQWWNLQAYQNTSECIVNTFLQAHSWFALNKHLSKSSLWILNKLSSNASQHISLRWNTNWCQIHPQNTQVNPKQSVWDFKQENWHRYWKAHVLYLQADVSMTARTTVRINIITIIMIPDKMRTPRVFLHRRADLLLLFSAHLRKTCHNSLYCSRLLEQQVGIRIVRDSTRNNLTTG